MLAMLPARPAGDDRGRLQGLRRPLEPDPGRVRRGRASSSRWKCIPPRSPTTSGRPSEALEAVDHRPAFGFNFDPSHFVLADGGPGRLHRRVRRPHLPRARQGIGAHAQRAQRHPRLAPGLRRSAAAAGTSSRRAAAACRSSASSARSTASATQGPLSVEWEDNGMNREQGAPEALALVRAPGLHPVGRGLRRGVSVED